ncbi:MAG: glutamate formimidoyltransferase [Planctomycetes bacterium]|nr:glutamate formimidoyltransferase [Planctomycetota bacterium]
MKLLECVPNFSEGRRPEVIDAICAEITSVPGIALLGREMDASHNRAVVTFVGPPEAAQEAAIRAMRRASQLIDLREHKGEHPRMGATDVVPFIPLGDATMADAVAAANVVAARAAAELSIPTYLYAEAARRPERVKLADVRKGEFEGLRAEVGVNPDRAPDFGPAAVHPSAGCTAVGARFFLIAFNVNLATDDVALAKRISKEIREKDGGLPGVQAMGFHLGDRNIAQVSMNLLDYRKTSPGRVFEEVRARAEAAGVKVLESEMIGLVPQAAVNQAFVDMAKPRGWTGAEIIESHLRTEPMDACAPFLAVLASDAPTPGGGSAAALAGAAGAALVTMVCNLTIGREKYAAADAELRVVRERASRLQEKLHAMIRRDAASYESYMLAMKLPKATPEEKAARKEAMGRAAVIAAETPLETMSLAAEVIDLSAVVVRKGNPNAASDGAVAALLGRAAVRGAHMNVRINLPTIQDEAVRASLASRADVIAKRTEDAERDAVGATGLDNV